MTDRPIPFSAPMVRALLEGRKTQTRRVLKPQPVVFRNAGDFYRPWPVIHPRTWCCLLGQYVHRQIEIPYAPGDRLYVREAWRTDTTFDRLAPRDLPSSAPIFYEADAGGYPLGATGKFRQGMHMPRWASRITLTVTNVRVQRVQEIDENDAIAEGCRPFFDYDNPDMVPTPDGFDDMEMAPLRTPVEAFGQLWNSLNAPRGFGWDANPWVVALTFTVAHRNIDAAEA